MNIILDTQPYILYETIGMLVKYVNGLSMLEVRDTMLRLYRKGLDDTWRRRLECLQKIIQSVCRDVDLEDPEIQYFFFRRELGGSRDATTLAWTMTLSFCEHQSHSLEEEASILKNSWQQIQERGFRLEHGYLGVSFVPLAPGEKQESLIRNVYRLGFASDYAMEVLNVLEDYDEYMDRLVRLITPYARRLEEKLKEHSWLMETLGTYWAQQFQTITPASFWADSKMGYQHPPVRSECHVCFSLMDCAMIHSEMAESILHPDRSLFVFGCAIVAECSKRMYSEDLDSVASAFRVLGDKSRLDLLMRLAQGRSYCQQLADEAHCNSGNMSRSLAALSKHGFLSQEQEPSRTYYRTDLETISKFFQEFEDLLARRMES